MINTVSEPHKIITAILPKGRDKDLIKKLVQEKGIQSVNITYARGLGKITPLRHRGVGETTEKSIVTIIIETSRANEIFEYVFYEADINRPHGGLMFQQPLLGSTAFELPEVEEEH